MPDHTDAITEHLAHLTRMVEELSDVVARQDKELDRLTRKVEMLVLREAEREADATGAVILGDDRPPHY